MYKTGIALNNGSGSQMIRIGLTYVDLQATSGSGAKTIACTDTPGNKILFPQGSIVLGVRARTITPFSGGSLSAVTVSMGKVGGTNTYFTAAYDVFAAASDTNVQETALFKAGQDSAFQPNLTVTPTGDNCSAATAGEVVYDVLVAYVTTPKA